MPVRCPLPPDRPDCAVITLTPGAKYLFPQQIVVSRPVTVMGVPFNNPILSGTTAPRSFLVVGGGTLDVRFCTFYSGRPEFLTDYLVIASGGALRIVLGGVGKSICWEEQNCTEREWNGLINASILCPAAIVTGCLFRIPPEVRLPFLISSHPETTSLVSRSFSTLQMPVPP